MTELTAGAIQMVVENGCEAVSSFVVAVYNLQLVTSGPMRKVTGNATDGTTAIRVAFSAKGAALYAAGELPEKALVRVSNCTASKQAALGTIMMILECEVVGKYEGYSLPDVEQPPAKRAAPESVVQQPPARLSAAPISPSEMPITPGASAGTPAAAAQASFSFSTPGSALDTPAPAASPAPFPASGISTAAKENDAAAAQTPAAAGAAGSLGVVKDMAHVPIDSLNPYKGKWTIRAKVDRKPELRRSMVKGQDTAILTVVLVDPSGKQIEGTFWRHMAEQMDRELQEGKVYYFSNGSVSPANRKYSSVDNDYKINFSEAKSFVRAAAVQDDAGAMKARYKFTKIDCLEALLGKKVPVDVVGIVQAVSATSSVKRQSDGQEFARRDVTLVDESRKTVSLTLWREQAETVGAQLEALPHPVVAISKVAVKDFNGVSLSTTFNSRIEIEPPCPEATTLRVWWSTEGAGATFVPVAEAPMRGAGPRGTWAPIEALVKNEAMLAAEDPPTFASLRVHVARIPQEQTLYYEANPATNKKVQQGAGGGWEEVGSGAPAQTMVRRYIVNAAVMDFSGSRLLNVFNEQAEAILGMPADAIHGLKEGSVEDFDKALERSQWTAWLADVMARPREYKGTVQQRINVRALRPLDWAADSNALLQLMATCGAA